MCLFQLKRLFLTFSMILHVFVAVFNVKLSILAQSDSLLHFCLFRLTVIITNDLTENSEQTLLELISFAQYLSALILFLLHFFYAYYRQEGLYSSMSKRLLSFNYDNYL